MNQKKLSDRAIWCRASPFLVYFSFMLLAELLMKFGWSADELRLLYAVRILTVASLLLLLRKSYIELQLPSNLSPYTLLGAATAGIAVFVAWINLDANWMTVGVSVGINPNLSAGIDWYIVIRLIGSTLVIPIMEELFWRSFLLRWVRKHDFLSIEPSQVGFRAFTITTVFFAFEHNLWLAGLVAGAVYNLLYMRSGSLWSPVLAHTITNGLLGCWFIYTGNWSYW